MGENILRIDLFETYPIIGTSATVKKILNGFLFQFFVDKKKINTAAYIINLNVVEKCSSHKLLSSQDVKGLGYVIK